MKVRVKYKRHGDHWHVTETDYDGRELQVITVTGKNKKEAEAAYNRIKLNDAYRER